MYDFYTTCSDKVGRLPPYFRTRVLRNATERVTICAHVRYRGDIRLCLARLQIDRRAVDQIVVRRVSAATLQQRFTSRRHAGTDAYDEETGTTRHTYRLSYAVLTLTDSAARACDVSAAEDCLRRRTIRVVMSDVVKTRGGP